MKGYHSVVKFVKSSFMNGKGKPAHAHIRNPYIVGQGGMEFTITWQPGFRLESETIIENGYLGKRIRIVKDEE